MPSGSRFKADATQGSLNFRFLYLKLVIMPRSKLGLSLSVIYVAVATFIAISERLENTSGDFISLNGLMTYLAAFPVSYVLDRVAGVFKAFGPGSLTFYERPYTTTTVIVIVAMIGLNGALVYAIGALIGSLVVRCRRSRRQVNSGE